MNHRYLAGIAVTAMLSLAVIAQAAQTAQPDAANPDLTVPAPHYESAFHGYRQWREPQTSPAKTWRAMNDGVASAGSSMAGMEAMPPMNAGKPAPDRQGMSHQHQGK